MLAGKELLARPVVGKSSEEIALEWDLIAHVRHMQIASGKDISFSYVLKPTLLELLQSCDLRNVLDIGSGTGELTWELAKVSEKVVGVDFSSRSIEIARRVCSKTDNVDFFVKSVEDFSANWQGHQFTTLVANMTLMDCLNLESLMEASAKLVVPGGHFVATITHPWFWPHYWGYADASWFGYTKELVIEAPFRISAEATDCVTTHVHRPLSTYLNSLSNAGFNVEKLVEPYPDRQVQSKYSGYWKFPRFLAFRGVSSAESREAYREANGRLADNDQPES